MQLVLEIDNPIIDINNKMADVEQNSLLDKAITNGDISHIDETIEKIDADCADIREDKVEPIEDGIKEKAMPPLETVPVKAEQNVEKEALSKNTLKSQLLIANTELTNNQQNGVTTSDLLVKEAADAQLNIVKENLNAQDSNVQTELEPMDIDNVDESLDDKTCSVESKLNQSLSLMVANIVKDLDEDIKSGDEVLDLQTSDAIDETKKDLVDSQNEIPVIQGTKQDLIDSQTEIPAIEESREDPIKETSKDSVDSRNEIPVIQETKQDFIDIQNKISAIQESKEDPIKETKKDSVDSQNEIPVIQETKQDLIDSQNENPAIQESKDKIPAIPETRKDSIDAEDEIPASSNSKDLKNNECDTEDPISNDEESNHSKNEDISMDDSTLENIVKTENVSNVEKLEIADNKIASENENSEDCMDTEAINDAKIADSKIASENENSENCMDTEAINGAKIAMSLNESTDSEDPEKNIQREYITDEGMDKNIDKDSNPVECKDSTDSIKKEDIRNVDMALHLNNDKVSGEGDISLDCNQDIVNDTRHIESKNEMKMDSVIVDCDLTEEPENTPVFNSDIQNDKSISVTEQQKDSEIIDISEKGLSESKAENEVSVDRKGVNITEGDIQDVPNASTSNVSEIVDLVGIDDNSDNKSSLSKDSDKVVKPVIQLSNTLDILSDDEETPNTEEKTKDLKEAMDIDKQCINLDDDDDIMLIVEDESATKDDKKDDNEVKKSRLSSPNEPEKQVALPETTLGDTKDNAIETSETKTEDISSSPSTTEVKLDDTVQKSDKSPPLIPEDFFKGYRKNLADMTRDDLEEFCLVKIVESIIDRSNLIEIRTKMKTMAVNIEDYKKKAMMLTKQNRDLQVVLKSIQEEQKKNTNQPIVPLKITRSVGMQVLMTEKTRKRQMPIPTPAPPHATNSSPVTAPTNNFNKPTRPPSIITRSQKSVNAQIPVPRLVPAANTILSKPQMQASTTKNIPAQNGVKVTPVLQKAPEKRTHSRMQSQSSNQAQSDTVDLTDDEPPSKVVANKNSPTQVRLLYPANPNIAPRAQLAQTSNSPRKVYIPITGPGASSQQSPIMLKTISSPSTKGKESQLPVVRVPQNAVGLRRVQNNRHPAPLPISSKQYQPPNWKSLPPAPDLKLSKVENGIVISWKIEGYREDSYEEIASYQLYAYQEPPGPPSTSLWKKIGDVKALPLPMACTLTQFMAGFKYYFAVRAVDVRSRFGPFSLPGSILLLNKM